jgi:hypothetical protein
MPCPACLLYLPACMPGSVCCRRPDGIRGSGRWGQQRRHALWQSSSLCQIDIVSRCCCPYRLCACRLGGRLEGAAAGGDTLCCHNLVMVTAHLYLAGALKADVVFSMLDSWRERYVRVCLWVCGCPASQHALLPACMQGWLADTASDAAGLPRNCRIAPSLFSL